MVKSKQLGFFEQNLSKRLFSLRKKENKHHHQIKHIFISLGTKSHLNQIILLLWTKFESQGYFRSKRKNLKSSSDSAYSNLFNYQISFWTDNFDFLDQIYPNIFGLKQNKWTLPSNLAYSTYSCKPKFTCIIDFMFKHRTFPSFFLTFIIVSELLALPYKKDVNFKFLQ